MTNILIFDERRPDITPEAFVAAVLFVVITPLLFIFIFQHPYIFVFLSGLVVNIYEIARKDSIVKSQKEKC